MGSMIQSQCKCGYESDELYLGGGMMDMGEKCELPFNCEKCKFVFSRNVLNNLEIKKYNLCPKCRKKVNYYGKIVEQDSIDIYNENVFNWNIDFDKTYVLENENNFCPKCRKEEMLFNEIGCWD
tara:strand:+ start:2052 stop:2423 length:372 start_codon:yes stop_codon:yes gene_type:complete